MGEQDSSMQTEGEYRLLCECCARVRIELTDQQLAELREQTGYPSEQTQRAVQLIRKNQVPHWYVWRGFPEDVTGAPRPGQQRSTNQAAPSCDCAEAPVTVGEQHIISIALTEKQRTLLHDCTGRDGIALECSAEVLDRLVLPEVTEGSQITTQP